MRLYRVNPSNPVASLNIVHSNRLNKYGDWKPPGLLVVAGLTPSAVIRQLRMIREEVIPFVGDNLQAECLPHHRGAGGFARVPRFRRLLPRSVKLAARSGCQGVFIGFESPAAEGQKGRNFCESVGRIQRHGMCVVGSFIIGIDTDRRGIGESIARAAREYGIDAANVLILTPLPGTRLYAQMEREGRIRSNDYPRDWKYYTLAYPVARYAHLAWPELVQEADRFQDRFYSYPRILRRMLRLAGNTHSLRTLSAVLVANLSYRSNHLLDRRIYANRARTSNLGDAHAGELGVESLSQQSAS